MRQLDLFFRALSFFDLICLETYLWWCQKAYIDLSIMLVQFQIKNCLHMRKYSEVIHMIQFLVPKLDVLAGICLSLTYSKWSVFKQCFSQIHPIKNLEILYKLEHLYTRNKMCNSSFEVFAQQSRVRTSSCKTRWNLW